MTKRTDEIKKGLVETIEEIAWVVEGGDAHDLQDACDMAHASMADALALIQQLEAQVPRWISVEERLPEPDTLVLVGDCSEVASGFYHWKHNLWITHGDIDVTHWMPLPEPPEWESPVGGNSDDFVHGNHG